MATKKFKTVAGYLRSMEENLILARKVEPGSDAERAIERGILNNLFLQRGLNELANNETPRDGVDRIRKLVTDPANIKTLDACRKWLARPRFAGARFVAVSSTAVPSGMIFRGVEYTQEETEALRAICRDQTVSMMEAVEIFQSQGGRPWQATKKQKEQSPSG